jgi:carboxymethylenebutenolidase
MDQRIIDLYDSFTHGHINRRDFIDRCASIVGSTAAAVAILPLLKNDYAKAATIAADDARLTSESITYDGASGKIKGYLVHLKGETKRPAVIVIHENRGLNPHIMDIARRLAVEGYLALAPDLLSSMGGTPSNEEEAMKDIGKLDLAAVEKDLVATVGFLETHPESTGKVGAIGFCWGGGMINQLAAASPKLNAAVAYYGRQIAADRVPNIKAPLLLQYGGLDKRIDAGIPAYEAALKANNKKFQIYIYDGANHAFNNDTSPERYNKAAADLAWSRTLAFFKTNLS